MSTLSKPFNVLLPFSHKRPKIRSTVSCRAGGDGENPEGRLNQRRDVLIGVGGLYGLGLGLGLGANQTAHGLPISVPDLSKCSKSQTPLPESTTPCCQKYTDITPVDFEFPSPREPLRVRRAAHLLDAAYIAKYTKAVELMKALPSDDPRSFDQQAFIHCAYCDGAYKQIGTEEDFQVHFSWLFFPWHRFYLYFHERILGKLIGDDTFALPFWNWDAPAGMQIPAIYTEPSSPLFDPLRDANHQPPTLIDLDYSSSDPHQFPRPLQIAHNLSIMYRQVVSNGKTAELFMGAPYRAGDKPNSFKGPGGGALEMGVHTAVHVWTGDPTESPNKPKGENMGVLATAAKDPVFYANHCNVDRMWDLWRGLGGKRNNFDDPDWLDTSFLFYDENKRLVKVSIKDCLDAARLRFKYQKVDVPWLSLRPTPKSKPVKGKKKLFKIKEVVFPLTLDGPTSATVARPRRSRSKKEKDEEEEVLVVEGIEFPKDIAVKFDVFVNSPEYKGVGPDSSEFAGSFSSVPHSSRHHHGGGSGKIITRLKLGICEVLEDLDVEGDKEIVVTLVPRDGNGKVRIGGVRIEFSS